MPDESALELESRRRIYHYVQDNPGTHMREVGRELDIPMGTLEYHLRYLAEEDLLATREDGRYTRYFVKGQTSRHEKDVLAAIRQETPRRIVAQLLMEPGSSHGEILEEFDVSASTLSFHLNKLVEAGVLEKEKSGRKNLYSVVDEDVASRVLIQYRESFVDDVVDRFAEVWMDLDAGLEGPPGTGPGGSGDGASGSEAEDEAGDDGEDEPREPGEDGGSGDDEEAEPGDGAGDEDDDSEEGDGPDGDDEEAPDEASEDSPGSDEDGDGSGEKDEG